MTIHELAGKPVPKQLLEDISALERAYFDNQPDVDVPEQRVAFGTSGHRGSSRENSFNEGHVLAICQAICEYRKSVGITGPLFLGIDTHALSQVAQVSAVEVFGGARVDVMIQRERGYTPTPVISHAILNYNKGRRVGLADGVVITPSHNPPKDGGIKYNPSTGGPATPAITDFIQDRANEILRNGVDRVRRLSFKKALKSETTHEYDYIRPYVADLINVVDLEAIGQSHVKIGIDPMGGSGIGYWEPIIDQYGLNATVVNEQVDPTFSFMTVDRDGRVRMDCSSPYAMASLINLREGFDVAVGNDPDFDRHGIVTKKGGLMNPNHYLSAAIWYLFRNRPDWGKEVAVGKTLVSSSMIDRVAKSLGRKLVEVPVGFKWFVEGLFQGALGFAGEESAGASFLRKDGTVWTTDKDGIILDLLAAEIMAVTQKDPFELYGDLEGKFGQPVYRRKDKSADERQKDLLKNMSPETIDTTHLAGEEILGKLVRAPGNNAEIGGLKVVTNNGWCAMRPSGTEKKYKIYAESFLGEAHLKQVLEEAETIVDGLFNPVG